MKAYKVLRETYQYGFGSDQKITDSFFRVIPDAGLKLRYSPSDLGFIKEQLVNDRFFELRIEHIEHPKQLHYTHDPSIDQWMKLKEMSPDEWNEYMKTQDTKHTEYHAVECEVSDELVTDLRNIIQMDETRKRVNSGLRGIILDNPKQAVAA